jgi:hypothetical protein
MSRQVLHAAETAINPAVTAVFMLLWLLLWPFYHLYRGYRASH